MRDAKSVLEQSFLEMRWRCLSLAADLDRVERSEGGAEALKTDARIGKLKQAMGILLEKSGNRAEQVERLFSDMSLPPARKGGEGATG